MTKHTVFSFQFSVLSQKLKFLWLPVLKTKNHKLETVRGFTLLIAVIFMSVMLAIGVAFASLGYKQILLASSAVESQHAFYVADSALECLLNYDRNIRDAQGDSWFGFENECAPPPISCEGKTATIPTGYSCTPSLRTYTERLSLDSDTHCADVKIYKQASGSTDLYAIGYNVPCDVVNTLSPGIDTDARIIVRGLSAHY